MSKKEKDWYLSLIKWMGGATVCVIALAQFMPLILHELVENETIKGIRKKVNRYKSGE